MLSARPKRLVHGSLIAKPEKGAPMEIVTVRMLKDAKGFTRHMGKPRLLKVSEGDEVICSDDLATLWVASKTCKLKKPSEDIEAAAEDVLKEQAAEVKRVTRVKATAAARRAKSSPKSSPKKAPRRKAGAKS